MIEHLGNDAVQWNAAAPDGVTVEREDGIRKGRYRVLIDGVEAEMTYSREGDSSMNIDHTQVDESLRGEGVAEKLLDAAVEFARENGLQVMATCPYAKKKLERNEDYADVYAGNE